MKQFHYLNVLKGLCLFLLITALYSCSTKQYPGYYLPAAITSSISYLPRPMNADSVKSRTYVSASYGNLLLPYSSGEIGMGQINISRGHQMKNFTYGYGVFGYAGKISEDDFTEYDNKRKRYFEGLYGSGLYGGGLRSTIGFYDTSDRTEFRIINWENSLSFEGGSYHNFRKQIVDSTNVIVSTKNVLYTTGLSSEIIWHSRKRPANHFAFRLFYGFTPGLSKNMIVNTDEVAHKMKDGVLSFSFYAKFNKMFLTYEGTGGYYYNGAKLSLGYSF